MKLLFLLVLVRFGVVKGKLVIPFLVRERIKLGESQMGNYFKFHQSENMVLAFLSLV